MPAPVVLFLRAVNVGGHQTFKPSQLARDLAPFETVNIGAAGTFVLRRPPAAAALAAEVRQRLPFETGVMICPARDILAAAADLAALTLVTGARAMLTVLAERPQAIPALPVRKPDTDAWELLLDHVGSRYAWTQYRPLGSRPLNVNAFVEKALGVAGTTRNANTLAAIHKVLSSSPSSSSSPSGSKGR
jgi:uncharacterized protein (DUF1697 family)